MDLEPLRTKLIADTNQFTPQIQRARDEFGRFIKTTDGATQAMQRHTRGVESATKALRDAQKQAKDHVHSINDISRALNAQRNVYHTLKGAVVEAYEAASEGAKIMAAEQFFKNAGKSIGDYRKATNGMVSDAELMKKANLADSMGISEGAFKQLVMVAEASALKTGQSFDYMFNSIIVGSARSSRLLLDNLGIIVSVGTANDKWADANNRTVESMTAQEKQLAFIDEVMIKSHGTLVEYANTTDRTAESFAKFDANVQNLADSIKIGLTKAFASVLPDLNAQLSNILEMLRSEQWSDVGKYIGLRLLQGVALGISSGMSMLNPVQALLKAAGMDIDFSGMKYVAASLGQQADTTLANAKAVRGGAQKQSYIDANNQLNLIKQLTGTDWSQAIQNFVDLGSAGIDRLTDVAIKEFLRMQLEAGELGKAFGSWTKKALPEGAAGANKGRSTGIGVSDLHSANQAFDKWLAGVLEREFVSAGRMLVAPFVSELTNALSASTVETNRQTKRLAEIQKLLDEAALERAQEVAGRVQGATEAVLGGGGLLGPIMGAIAPALGSSITAALTAASMSTAVAGPLGGVLAGAAVVLVGLIDKLKPITNLLGAIVDGLSLLIQHGLGDLLATLEPLSPALRELLAAVGILVGSALRPFISMMAIGVGIVTAVVQAVSFLLVVLSPFIEAIFTVVGIFVTFGTALLGLVGGVEGVVGSMKTTLAVWGSIVLGAAIAFNNGFVAIARSWFGLKGFGKYLDYDDFQMGDDEAIEDNTDAVAENTRALRDFSREFRNLPQNYKVAGAIYNASAPGMGRASLGGAIRIGSGTGLSAEDISNMNGLRDRL